MLEPRGNVDRVAGDERLALATDHNLPGVHPDPRLEPVLADRGLHLHSRAHRAEGVVLVGHRDPEDGHDRVAHELLHSAAVLLDDRAQILEVATHASAQRLRIGRLSKRR